MPTVVLLGTLDTKATETLFVRDRVLEAGCCVILVDVGVLGPAASDADSGRETVGEAAGTTLAALVRQGDRGAAVTAMGRGAAAVVRQLHAEGRLDAVLALGGSGGTCIATDAMRALPVSVPKLVVSAVASGQVGPYVGQTDITMMHAVLDVAGLDSVSRRIFANAAAVTAGMVHAAARRIEDSAPRSAVAITMFGVTTPAATAARHRLERQGYEVLVFHANEAGGRALEELAGDELLVGVLDLITTELADELVGGTLSAGPDRLTVAGRRGLPQVVSLGASDMVNFGQRDTVPVRFADRLFYQRNDQVTLMRTTAAKCRELGRILRGKLGGACGPSRSTCLAVAFSCCPNQGRPSMMRQPTRSCSTPCVRTARRGPSSSRPKDRSTIQTWQRPWPPLASPNRDTSEESRYRALRSWTACAVWWPLASPSWAPAPAHRPNARKRAGLTSSSSTIPTGSAWLAAARSQA